MNTETSNKILAEFIGYKVATTQEEYDNYIESGFANVTWHISDLQFNSFLDALLPVWEKIESLGYAVIVKPDAVRIIDYNNEDKSYMGGQFICMGSRLTIDQTLIGAFNLCFLQFIHQYNQQTENATN